MWDKYAQCNNQHQDARDALSRFFELEPQIEDRSREARHLLDSPDWDDADVERFDVMLQRKLEPRSEEVARESADLGRATDFDAKPLNLLNVVSQRRGLHPASGSDDGHESTDYSDDQEVEEEEEDYETDYETGYETD